jgi:predicted  nucleic acid-binding Zn-ribbon protein
MYTPIILIPYLQDSDLFFSINQKSEAEVKYIEKESEYFARCVKAEESSEELEQENKKLQAQLNDLKYQLAKVKVEGEKVKTERDKLRETVESLKKELAQKSS